MSHTSFHISSCGFFSCCLRNRLHEVCQATRQSLLQRVEKAAAEENTYTHRFNSSLSVPFRSAIICERSVNVLDILRYIMEAPSENGRPSRLKQLKIKMPCWTKVMSSIRVLRRSWCCALELHCDRDRNVADAVTLFFSSLP